MLQHIERAEIGLIVYFSQVIFSTLPFTIHLNDSKLECSAAAVANIHTHQIL
jgi:hypothetical protein